MSEQASPTPTPEASAGDPAAETVSGAPAGSEGGTQAADGGDAFATERERYESQIRNLQSDRDRAVVRAERAEAARAPEPSGDAMDSPLTEDRVAEVTARVFGLAQTAERLRSSDEFRHADPSIFDRAHEFKSPEALRVAAGESHAARAAIFEAGFKAGQDALGAAPAPPDPGPAGSQTGVRTSGLPTAEELSRGGLRALEDFRAQFDTEAEYQRALSQVTAS